MPKIPGQGLVKGLGVTFKTMLQPAVTVQYPQGAGGARRPGPGRHRPQGGELHRVHALRP